MIFKYTNLLFGTKIEIKKKTNSFIQFQTISPSPHQHLWWKKVLANFYIRLVQVEKVERMETAWSEQFSYKREIFGNSSDSSSKYTNILRLSQLLKGKHHKN